MDSWNKQSLSKILEKCFGGTNTLIASGKSAIVYKLVENDNTATALRIQTYCLSEDGKTTADEFRREMAIMKQNFGYYKRMHNSLKSIIPEVYSWGVFQTNALRRKPGCVVYDMPENEGNFNLDSADTIWTFTKMQYIDGLTLSGMEKHIHTDKKIKRIAKEHNVTVALLKTLKTFWESGLVHGDLAGSNVIWSIPNNQWYIIDISSHKTVKFKTKPPGDYVHAVYNWLKTETHPDLFYFENVIMPMMLEIEKK